MEYDGGRTDHEEILRTRQNVHELRSEIIGVSRKLDIFLAKYEERQREEREGMASRLGKGQFFLGAIVALTSTASVLAQVFH